MTTTTPTVTAEALLCGTVNADDIPNTDTMSCVEDMVKEQLKKNTEKTVESMEWTPFIAGVGVWLIGLGYCPMWVAEVLAHMIINGIINITCLKDYNKDTEDKFCKRFPAPCRVVVLQVYKNLVQGKRPLPTPNDVQQQQQQQQQQQHPVKRPIPALETKEGQACSSDFSKLDDKVVMGIGHMDVGRIVLPGSIVSKLVPGPEVEQVPEVQEIAMELTKLYGVPHGALSSFLSMSNVFWGMVVWEDTRGETATSSGLCHAGDPHGNAIATAIATSLPGLGFDASEVLVPVIVYNGTQIQFACVYMLQPSFPVYSLASVPFSLYHEDEQRKAAAFVLKVKEIAKANLDRIIDLTLNNAGRTDLSKVKGYHLDQDLYHFKVIGEDFPRRGGTTDYGCSQMLIKLGLMSCQLDDQDMKLIVFPLAVHVEDNGQGTLVFDKLDREDYEGGPFHVGLPDPNTDDWEKWLLAVEHAFYIIHHKGKMVHVDPYPSNIMWRRVGDGGGDVEVKIIDWDGIHEVGEEWATNFLTRVKQNAQNRQALGWSATAKASALHDLQYLRVLRGLDVKEHREICQDLASRDVNKINDAFRRAAVTIDIRKIEHSHLLGYGQ